MADADLAKLRKDAEALRDRRLLGIRDSEIESVVLESGSRKLELKEKDSQWSFSAYREGKVVASGEADAGAVDKWLKALRAMEAIRFLPAEGAAAKDKKIKEPSIVLSVGRSGKAGVFLTRIEHGDERELFARRGEEPSLSVFPASAAGLLEPSSARFRPLGLPEEEKDRLSAIEIRRGEEVETLAKDKDGGWAIEKPLRVPADPVLSGELAGNLAAPKASRFVEDFALPAHGLEEPAMVVTARYAAAPARAAVTSDTGAKGKAPAAEHTRVLKIGEKTEGGRFAQLDASSAVFVLSDSLLQAIAEPLVNRALCSTAVEQLESLKIATQEKTAEIARRGDGFTITGGGEAPSERASKLAERFAGLRAMGAEYGDLDPKQGLQPPAARIAVVRVKGAPEPQTYELLVGGEVPGASPEPMRYLRRADLAVTFTVPASVVNDLLAATKQ